MSAPPLSDSEREDEIRRVRQSDLSYADAACALAQLTDPGFDGYIKPKPPTPPSRLEILEAEVAAEKAAKLEKWNEYTRELHERLKSPSDPFANIAPTSHPVFKRLEQEAAYDPHRARWIAEALHADGYLPAVEFEIFMGGLPPVDPAVLQVAKIDDWDRAANEADRLHDEGVFSDAQHKQCCDLLFARPSTWGTS